MKYYRARHMGGGVLHLFEYHYKQSCEGRKAVTADNDSACAMYITSARLIAGMIWFIEMHGNKL